jgi:hypothetical protein
MAESEFLAPSEYGREFLAASEYGRLALFIRAVMTELGQSRLAATTIYEDNGACIKVADSSAPTLQMRHIAIPDFALHVWTDRDLVNLVSCPLNVNSSSKLENIFCGT